MQLNKYNIFQRPTSIEVHFLMLPVSIVVPHCGDVLSFIWRLINVFHDMVFFFLHLKCFLNTLQLVEKLLVAAVADADVTVRHCIFSSLHENRGSDDFLAQADSLRAVFVALSDEVYVWHLYHLNFCLFNNCVYESILHTWFA